VVALYISKAKDGSMSPSQFSKVAAKTAAEVCRYYEVSTSAQKVLSNGVTPRQFVEQMVQLGQYTDAFDFLAHALPRRDAIWWACLSVRHCQGPALPPEEFAALKAAVEWVLEPDEPKRHAAHAAGRTAGFGTPAGGVAVAVYRSGGSLGPGSFADAPPGQFMTAAAVSNSISKASATAAPGAISEVLRELVELGISIADGKFTWPAVIKGQTRFSTIEPTPGRRF
jgi:hypothetical protein